MSRACCQPGACGLVPALVCEREDFPGAPRGRPARWVDLWPGSCRSFCTVSCETGAGTREACAGSSPAWNAVRLSTDGPSGICGALGLDVGRGAACPVPSGGSALPNPAEGVAAERRLGGHVRGPRQGDARVSSAGAGGAAGPIRTAHQARLVPSTRLQQPTRAMRGPGHLWWRGCVPRPRGAGPGPPGQPGAPPQTAGLLRMLALGHARQNLALEVRRSGRLEQAE